MVSSIETDGSNARMIGSGNTIMAAAKNMISSPTLFSALTRSCRASSRFAAATEREILGNIAVDTDTAMSE